MGIVEQAACPWRENRPGSRVQEVLDPASRVGGESAVLGLGLVNQVCEPGAGAPSHTHAFEEIVTVLEGVAEVWLGEDHRTVGPGTSVFIPTGILHGFRNVGEGPLRVQAVIAGRQFTARYEPSEG